jgi:uncharacterized protein (TIGR03437 family)
MARFRRAFWWTLPLVLMLVPSIASATSCEAADLRAPRAPVEPGDRIAVEGVGFGTCSDGGICSSPGVVEFPAVELVVATASGKPRVVQQITVTPDSIGHFSADIPVPSDLPAGRYTLSASVTDPPPNFRNPETFIEVR